MLSNLIIEKAVRAALEEDLGRDGDVTSDILIPADARAMARLVAREDGVVAGLDVALAAFRLVDAEIKAAALIKDGDSLKKNQTIAEIEGAAKGILAAERTALNFLTHLSGIATLTRRYVDAVSGTRVKILDTRKTLPGLRAFEKYAVATGGGTNHRFGLYDAVLIKDNHIALAGGISQALGRAGSDRTIEIEVETLDQLEEVLRHGGADTVLLDNMDLQTLKKAAAIAKGKITTEASGGITLENVREIAETGMDVISIGTLTHSAPALDIALDVNV